MINALYLAPKQLSTSIITPIFRGGTEEFSEKKIKIAQGPIDSSSVGGPSPV